MPPFSGKVATNTNPPTGGLSMLSIMRGYQVRLFDTVISPSAAVASVQITFWNSFSSIPIKPFQACSDNPPEFADAEPLTMEQASTLGDPLAYKNVSIRCLSIRGQHLKKHIPASPPFLMRSSQAWTHLDFLMPPTSKSDNRRQYLGSCTGGSIS